jgi:hypothetical protein
LSLMIGRGVPLDVVDGNQCNALHRACVCNCLLTVEVLLESSDAAALLSRRDQKGRMPIYRCCQHQARAASIMQCTWRTLCNPWCVM